MTILEAITKIQNVKPNQYDDELMVEWLSDLDGMIYHEYIKWHLKPKKEPEEPSAEDEPQTLPEKAPLGDMSWADILAVANAGKAKEYYDKHDTKTIYFDDPVLGSDSIVVEIAGFDYDDLADGSGKAPISFLMKNTFAESMPMHQTSTAVVWPNTYFFKMVLPAVRNAIVKAVGSDIISPVIKKTTDPVSGKTTGIAVPVWQPSHYEVCQVLREEEAPDGIDYCYPVFDVLDASTRIKYHPDEGYARGWWLRTNATSESFYLIPQEGQAGTSVGSTTEFGIVVGFCVGKVEQHEEEEEPERAKWPYDPELDMDTTLLVPEPYSNLYVKYLAAQVDYFNGEIARYNNSMVMFNTALSAFADWYNRSNMPNQDNFIRF